MTVHAATLARIALALALGQGTTAQGALLCFDAAGLWRAGATQAQGAEHCHEIALPAGAQVQWAFMPKKPPAYPPRLAATGASRPDARFQPYQITAAPGPTPSVALPFGQPLLPLLAATPFGSEERATVTHSAPGRVTLTCRRGERPAGLVLHAPGKHLPRAAAGSLRLAVAADAGFSVGLATAGQDPRVLQPIGMAAAPATISVPLPETGRAAAAQAPDALVVVCPDTAATLSLTDAQLLPGGAPRAPARAGWAWKTDRWLDGGGDLLRAARQYRIRTLYISVQIDGGRLAQPAALARFIRQASANGVAVWAVEGDPGMVLGPGRGQALRRLRAILQYQSAAAAHARLAGVQYDIEPYLLPGYAENPEDIALQWRDTLGELGAAAGPLPMDVVLPFWILGSPGATQVLSSVRAPGRSITVMAYRSDPAAIQAAAEPLLAWGALNRVPVHVALEAGPLPDELTQHYALDHSAEKSIMWTIPMDDTEMLVRLDRPLRLERGHGYQWTHDSLTPASQISFLGNWPRMRAAVDALQHVFPAWTSYAGMSLHGLLD